jgi:hypothetical protein
MTTIFLKYLKKVFYVFFLLSSCLFILECCFRYQIIDFYSTELKGLNTEKQLNSTNNILVFGDSFTAHPESYVSFLRNEFSSFNFINSAVPGTGIKQHELSFKKRINQFKPKAIIYQFYVGNDFLDINHPINLKTNSFLKNCYWKISEKILVLQYLNFKLAFLNRNNQPIEKLQEPKFSIEQYNNRVKSNYKANTNALNNTILLTGDESKSIYSIWKNQISQLNELVNDSIPIYLLLIPHNSQVNSTNFNRNLLLGAKLREEIMDSNYPLAKTISKDFKSWKIINPLAAFKQFDKNDSLYYQNDPHLTISGQKKLSELVAKELQLNE